ncbi:Outer membrane protein A [Aquicella siphonis]|uniref:Outer membrane protein A n=1 Tax=Aquicella siphonis TaxID=254247 RepID=A0A5E4PJN6_9COXI|nr:outer membrane beta-barrel protein [Aquicella siphonis]VVC76561.1 Outer membrane protein A [Aquicella siphonis]
MLTKKIMLGVAALGLSSLVTANAFAAAPGFYVGGQLGYGNVHQSDISRTDMNDLIGSAVGNNKFTVNSFNNSGKDTGLAGRLFAGYQVNSNWAGELGWSKFSTMNTKASATATDNNPGGSTVTANARGNIKTDAVDLVAKGIYPLQNNVSVYGKVGAAYIMSRAHASASASEAGVTVSGSGSKNSHKIFPTVGVGASYDFTSNVAADLSYNRIQKVGSSSNIGSTDLVSVGLTYYIG